MEPAIEIAERGHAVASVVARKWAAAVPELKNQPGFADAFMPHGRAPEVSELIRMPGHAKTLRLLAEKGPRAYYEGEIAERIAAFAREAGGAMTFDDLRNYQPDWVEPIGKDYRGYTVHEIPPNGQGIAALIALGILEQFDVASLKLDGIESQHLQIEAMKLAFADVYRYVADPRSMEVTPEQMLDDAYLKSRAKLIDPKRATQFDFGMPKTGGTIYMSAADERGMMVSFIQSNYMGFGSGCVVPGMGISLQNRGCGFSMDPKSPNVVEGGKRPFHTIIPAFLTASSRRPLATRRAGRSTATSPSTSKRRSIRASRANSRTSATRSSRSTIRIWILAPASSSGSSTATSRIVAMSLRATAVATVSQRGSERAPAARREAWNDGKGARAPSPPFRSIRHRPFAVLAFNPPCGFLHGEPVFAHRADPSLVRMHRRHRMLHARLEHGGLRVIQHAVGEAVQQRAFIVGLVTGRAVRHQQHGHAF
jgi:hypothetical protein